MLESHVDSLWRPALPVVTTYNLTGQASIFNWKIFVLFCICKQSSTVLLSDNADQPSITGSRISVQIFKFTVLIFMGSIRLV